VGYLEGPSAYLGVRLAKSGVPASEVTRLMRQRETRQAYTYRALQPDGTKAHNRSTTATGVRRIAGRGTAFDYCKGSFGSTAELPRSSTALCGPPSRPASRPPRFRAVLQPVLATMGRPLADLADEKGSVGVALGAHEDAGSWQRSPVSPDKHVLTRLGDWI
jgi:hypothetical protein